METFFQAFDEKQISALVPKKLLYFASDGASVNSDTKNGLIRKFRDNFGEHNFFVVSLAHRLELAVKDAFKGTIMDDVDRILTSLYQGYKTAAKNGRELQELFEAIKEDFDFEDNSLRPSKAYGTRWIVHRLRAMHKLYDKFEVFALHFENLTVPEKK